ncbi:MAG TPA: hypothetical protein VN240_05630 [Propylenella sp.]|nr:hypothetical protein [Propylenella sp.]
MGKLNIGVEIRDFDLERMGFSISVLDDATKQQCSEAYLRMTLPQLNTLLSALRAADGIEVSTAQPSYLGKAAGASASVGNATAVPSGAIPKPAGADNGSVPKAADAKKSADTTVVRIVPSRSRASKS